MVPQERIMRDLSLAICIIASILTNLEERMPESGFLIYAARRKL